uniref:Uncharacterized protein n=1 Tax=viral metagenome TaxID=1070528 RepID=A0A6C0DWU9_9ZZZZ
MRLCMPFIFERSNMMEQIQMDKKDYQKMMFLKNALEDGWSIKKVGDTYIFSKKHENRKEIFQSDYLERFIENNLQGLSGFSLIST